MSYRLMSKLLRTLQLNLTNKWCFTTWHCLFPVQYNQYNTPVIQHCVTSFEKSEELEVCTFFVMQDFAFSGCVFRHVVKATTEPYNIKFYDIHSRNCSKAHKKPCFITLSCTRFLKVICNNSCQIMCVCVRVYMGSCVRARARVRYSIFQLISYPLQLLQHNV